jgi:hypothetical protein
MKNSSHAESKNNEYGGEQRSDQSDDVAVSMGHVRHPLMTPWRQGRAAATV